MASDIVISNGQIFTPGFAILNAPQPGTPLGGETLHISLDVTANGELPLSLDDDSPSRIHNITVFLYSYDTGRNFTVTNGTAGEDDASLGNILEQESGSTVKHIDWVWPECLVGDGKPDDEDSDRGAYNISIRQSFRLNGEEHYTIFDVPISVTNSIEEDDDRPPCDVLINDLLSPEDIDIESANEVGVFMAPDDATEIEFGDVKDGKAGGGNDGGDGGGDDGGDDGSDGGDQDDDDPDFGGQRPEAGPEDGLGEDAGVSVTLSWGILLAAIVAAAVGM